VKVILPGYVKEQAEIFADSEAKRGTKAWENSFNRYCTELYSTSLIPAEGNPATAEHEVLVNAFSEIFDKFSSKKKDKRNNQKRLLGIIANLSNLFMELELGMKIHADRDADLGNDSQLSSFQMPITKGLSKDKTEEILKQKVFNRYVRLLVNTIVAESIIPFMSLSGADLKEIVATSGFKDHPANELKKSESLMSFAMGIRSNLNHVFEHMDLKKMILQRQMWLIAKKKSMAG